MFYCCKLYHLLQIMMFFLQIMIFCCTDDNIFCKLCCFLALDPFWMFSSHLSWFMVLCHKQQFCHETLTILVVILDIYANFLGCIFLRLLSTTPTFPGAPEPWTVIRLSIVPKSPGFFLGASLKAKERISWQMLIAGLWKVGSERTRGHVTRSW